MIRLLTSKDTPDYRRLRLISRQTDPQAFISLYQEDSLLPLEHFSHLISSLHKPPTFGIHGSFFRTQLIAHVQLSASLALKQQHLAYIYELYVHPHHRRQGIAKQLINHVISLASSQPPLDQLLLRVNSNNLNAIHLYRQLGFTHFATTPRAFKDTDTYQDESHYLFDLSKLKFQDTQFFQDSG